MRIICMLSRDTYMTPVFYDCHHIKLVLISQDPCDYDVWADLHV